MNDSSSSLVQLLAAIRRGDSRAQEAVLVRYRSWLELLARMQAGRQFQGKFSASDIVQDTLLAAHRDLGQFRGATEAELLAWLRQILGHVLAHEIRRYRGTQRRDLGREVSLDAALAESSQKLADFLAASQSSPSAQCERSEQEVRLADVLATLPENYRDVIILRNIEGLSHEEVAQRLGRSVGAVRMLWMRALAQMREALKEMRHA